MTSNTLPTLTDRYVAAAIAHAPAGQREDLAREIRALIADTMDAVEARNPAPALGPAVPSRPAIEIERTALNELGDPAALAIRYSGRVQHLIGPTVYPAWRSMLILILSIVVPIVAAVIFAARLMEGATVGEAILSAGWNTFEVALQTLFWFTLVFAIIERTVRDTPRETAFQQGLESVGASTDATIAALTGADTPRGTGWTVDDLPAHADGDRITPLELGATIATTVFALAGITWVWLGYRATVDGASFQLFAPDVATLWIPWFIGVLIIELLFTIAVFLRGRWTTTYAVGNALLGLAFAAPAVYLLANDLLLNPELVAAIDAATGSAWLRPTFVISAVVIVVICVWDAIDGFAKARRARVRVS
jgi:hypothetical protein